MVFFIETALKDFPAYIKTYIKCEVIIILLIYLFLHTGISIMPYYSTKMKLSLCLIKHEAVKKYGGTKV
jgi:hypothetical protein